MKAGLSAATIGSWGHQVRDGLKQIAVRLTDEQFAELKARAIKEGCSMQKKLQDYILTGLEIDHDWDKDR